MAPQNNVLPHGRRKQFIVFGASLTLFTGVVLVLCCLLNTTSRQNQSLDIDDLLQDACCLHKKAMHKRVVELLAPHAGEFDDDIEILRMFARSRIQVPEPDNQHVAQTIRLYQRIIDLSPDDIEACKELFHLNARIGKRSQALRFGKRAAGLEPENIELVRDLVQVMILDGDHAGAIEFADRILQQNPGDRPACQMRLQAMVRSNVAEDKLLKFIESASRENPGAISRTELLLMLAIAQEDNDTIQLILDGSPPSFENADQAAWFVRILERYGKTETALEVLRNAQREFDSSGILGRGLAYRIWHQGRYQSFFELVQSMPKAAASTDEMLILRTLAHVYDGDPATARKVLALLDSRSTGLARTWRPVLKELTAESASATNLLTASRTALNYYPQSAFLEHCVGLALESATETDLAFSAYRNSIKQDPRWIVPRISLSRLMLRRNRPAAAFHESAAALEINPESPAAFEVVLLSAIELIKQGTHLNSARRLPILGTLEIVKKSVTNARQKLVLQAIAFRLSDENKKAERAVANILNDQNPKDAFTLDILQALTTNPSVLGSIQQRKPPRSSESISQAMKTAVDLANRKGIPEGVRYIKGFDFSGFPNPDVARRVSIARLHSDTGHPDSAKVWIELSRDFPNDRGIQLMLVLGPMLDHDRNLKKEALDRLKKCTDENGITWQLSEIKFLMDGDRSQKAAAQAVLRLTAIKEQAPTSAMARSLLVEAYDRLGQTDKANAVLKEAVADGLSSTTFALKLAERLTKAGRLAEAAEYAYLAGVSPNSSPETRLKSSVVLLQAKTYAKAVDVMRPDVPNQLQDTEPHFTFMAAYSLACANIGQADQVRNRLSKMARISDRWFDLWLSVATNPKTPVRDAADWLSQAGKWLDFHETKRRRDLSRAWAELARREKRSGYYSRAIDVLRPAIPDDDDYRVRFQLATLQLRAGNQPEATELFAAITDSNAKGPVKAAACNNLAMILAKDDADLKRCERLARIAVSIDQRPEYVDTLAFVLTRQNRAKEAVDVLQAAIPQSPKSAILQTALAESLVNAGELQPAKQVLTRIEKMADNLPLNLWQRINRIRSRLNAIQENQPGPN